MLLEMTQQAVGKGYKDERERERCAIQCCGGLLASLVAFLPGVVQALWRSTDYYR